MKKVIESIIQLRNPQFQFDKQLNTLAIIEFSVAQLLGLIRGMRFLLYFKNPKGAILSKNVVIKNISKIYFGKFLKLGNNVTLSAIAKDGIIIGNNVGIGAFSSVIVSTSFNNIGQGITIGNNVGIGEFAYLGGAAGLTIGNDCIIGQYFSCHPENHNYLNSEILIRNQGVTRKGISVGNNCWIGSKVTILDGVSIGEGCVIAAGSVVTKSFGSNSIIGGVPAKYLKARV